MAKCKDTITLIDKRVVQTSRDGHRPHLGASQIGQECPRALWYQFRWAAKPNFPGRILRLFKRGHKEEDSLIYWLEQAGVKVQSIDPETGKQWQVEAHGGHFGGSLDGVAKGLVEDPDRWHVLEFKTHSDKSFKDLKKNGVQKSKPQHYAQMQVYMHLIGYDRAFYLSVNKNDDELYSEIVELDPDHAKTMLSKAEQIIFSDIPPDRIGGPDWYVCKWCDYSDICHRNEPAERNCRTCAHITPEKDGGWTCAQSREIDRSGAALPCHRYNPHMRQTPVSELQGENVSYIDGWTDEGPGSEEAIRPKKLW